MRTLLPLYFTKHMGACRRGPNVETLELNASCSLRFVSLGLSFRKCCSIHYHFSCFGVAGRGNAQSKIRICLRTREEAVLAMMTAGSIPTSWRPCTGRTMVPRLGRESTRTASAMTLGSIFVMIHVQSALPKTECLSMKCALPVVRNLTSCIAWWLST